MHKIPNNFECMPYGDFEQITPLISKGRLRIYYLGKNRNYTYITEEFSKNLEKYLPYVPVVGIYNNNKKDFGSHSRDRNEANTYGLVPENPNISWEEFLDEDEVIRTYLCCDVYLYTGRYDAAKEIIGKKHSMELNPDSLDGYWEKIDGKEYFVYTKGFFDGLCVLGNNINPCFEGSRFFEENNNQDSEKTIINLLNEYVKEKTNNFSLNNNIGGNSMEEKEKIILDNELENENKDLIENFEKDIDQEILTPLEEEEKDDIEEEKREKEDRDIEDEDTMEKKRKCELYEDASLESIMDFFPSVKENFENLNTKILELNNTITTFETEKDALNLQIQELNEKCNNYEAEIKKELDLKKDSLINEYSGLVSEKCIEKIKEKKDSYSLEDLEKDLLFSIKQEKPNLFKQQENYNAYSSLRREEAEGIVSILTKYKQAQLH